PLPRPMGIPFCRGRITIHKEKNVSNFEQVVDRANEPLLTVLPAPAVKAQDRPIAEHACRWPLIGAEQWFTLFPDYLVIASDRDATWRIPLADIDHVHLRLFWAKDRTHYLCDLYTVDGYKVSVSNMHFQGYFNHQDRRATYTPFVRALLERLAPRAGEITF